MELVPLASKASESSVPWEQSLAKAQFASESTVLAYGAGIGIVVLITLLGLPIRPYVKPSNLAMLYLLGVVIAALQWGRGPAVLTAVLSTFALDVVFIPPHFDLIINDVPSQLAFTGLLVVALVIGTLTAQARDYARAAQRRERLATASYQLSLELSSAAERATILHVLLRHVRQIASWEAAVFILEGGETSVAHATDGYETTPDGPELATQLIKGQKQIDPSSQILVAAKTCYLPLQRGGEIDGVLSVQPLLEGKALPVDQHQLLWSFASQAALALERARLAEQARRAEMMEVAEQLQAALLSSISHNLRTPLASISGTLGSLQEPDVHLDEEMQQELIATAWREANHLNQLVGNLLDMSRLESGMIRVNREPCDVQDLIGVALSEMRDRLEGRSIETHVPDKLSLVPMDFVLMVQVLVNLLDNALKYSALGSSIIISAERVDEAMQISVSDRGSGIPVPEQARIFEKFYQVNPKDGAGGTGLGLSIVKGIVDAHCGDISVHSVPGEGTTFTISLPFPATHTEASATGLEEEDE